MRTRQSPRAPLTPVALQAALRAFAPRHVRVMRDASRAPYCFVDFPDAAAAKRAMDAFGGSARGAAPRPPCLLYTSPSPRDKRQSRMPSSA